MIGVRPAFSSLAVLCNAFSSRSFVTPSFRVQMLQAWREHRRLTSTLPLPRPAFNRQFFAAALARLKNIANALYAACEVRPCMRRCSNQPRLTRASGHVLVDGGPPLAQQDARSRQERVSALFFLAAGLAPSAAAACLHRRRTLTFAQILVHLFKRLANAHFRILVMFQFKCCNSFVRFLKN